MLTMSEFGAVDWHVTRTADVIANKRREGWTDAAITSWLLSPDGKDSCPWGCDDEKVAAAFSLLATGQLPPGTDLTTTPEPKTPAPTASKRTSRIALAIGGTGFALWRFGRQR